MPRLKMEGSSERTMSRNSPASVDEPVRGVTQRLVSWFGLGHRLHPNPTGADATSEIGISIPVKTNRNPACKNPRTKGHN